MCSCPEHLNPETPVPSSSSKSTTSEKDMDYPIGAVKTEISFSNMLEFAADNYVEGFKQSILSTASAINEMGLWYGRQTPSTKMVLGHKTPLMVASMYGSVDVVKLILSLSEVDVNCCCGPDKGTALHCAASSGSVNVVDVIKLLLLAGADLDYTDAHGHRAIDVKVPPLGFPKLKDALEEVLQNKDSAHPQEIHVSSKSNSPPLSSSLENGSVSSALDATCSPNHHKLNDIHLSSAPEKREYLVDPSLPDIKNSLYSTDEFRMYSFKIHPCSRAYSHDWTECPFVHLGENARRRDPRKFHYSSVPCPDFRKGECRRGEMCEYSHGVFECWLHPAQYRTRICKEGTSCDRRVCFFAHSPEELRPLYVSSGAVVLSPRSAASAATAMDMAAALNLLPGGSPTAFSAISPTLLAPFMSPGNGVTHPSTTWPLPNIPPLHLPGSNLQMSHLRSSLNTRDIPSAEFNMLLGFEGQQQRLLNELSYFSQSNLNSATTNLSIRSKTINPLNLDEIFSVEVSPPRFSDQVGASAVFSPSHQSVILNPLPQQQKMISPVNMNLFSPQNVDHPLLPVPFGLSSPGRTSMRGLEPQSPFSARIFTLVQHEEQQLSSRDLGIHLPWDLDSNGPGIVSSPVNSLSNWETSNGRVDWSVNTDELARVKRSFSKGCGGEEPEFHGFSH